MSDAGSRAAKAQRSPLPLPHPWGWGVVAFLLFVALLATLRAVGRGHEAWQTPEQLREPLQWLSDQLAAIYGGAGQALTFTKEGANTGVKLACLTVLILFFWALWRALLARNAYKPGSVDVRPFTDASARESSDQRIEDLTAQFRKQLSETELYPPSTQPSVQGAPVPAESFLDLLADVDISANAGTSLLKLFGSLRPKVAYRVSGVLRERDHPRGCGVTVTVTSYSKLYSRCDTLWEASFEQAVHSAACWVMAALVPVTRVSKRPPWRGWRGRELPHQLFGAYQEGRRLSRARKFDEALHHFYEALHRDPANLYLRTQIAVTQEKLGLPLDALDMYHGALTLGRLDAEEENARLWAAPLSLRRLTCMWHWRQRSGVMQARYRYTVVLGTQLTAKQWADTQHPRRAEVRQQIREALTPAFVDRYWPAAAEFSAHRDESSAREWIREQLACGPQGSAEPGRTERVRLVLQLAATQEVRRLAQDNPMAALFPGSRTGSVLTRRSFRVFRDVLQPLRLAWAWAEFPDKERAPLPTAREGGLVQLRPAAPAVPGKRRRSMWTPRPMLTTRWDTVSPERLVSDLRAARTLFFRERHTSWPDHYLAACAYGVAMNSFPEDRRPDAESTAGAPRTPRSMLTELAVKELVGAVQLAESGFLQVQGSWLLAEDPDLAPLRGEPAFTRFEREAYPSAGPDRRHFPDPPPTVLEMTSYDRRLLSGLATAMERTWHRRRHASDADVSSVRDWFDAERQIWESLHHVSESGARSWTDRERLLEQVREAADTDVLTAEAIPTRVPEYGEVTTGDGEAEVSSWEGAHRLVATLEESLGLLERSVGARSGLSPIRRSHDWLRVLRRADARHRATLPPATVRDACDRWAFAWQTLHDYVTDPENNRSSLHRALHRLASR